ncbi:hypothetical protein [Celerinatantimonas yamalensis]|uniref:Uncharacterized protein n=1 Tax=Celerinatantimonas yamalensis TaxID=559956 RepID=A0ABW9G991_9GAMM
MPEHMASADWFYHQIKIAKSDGLSDLLIEVEAAGQAAQRAPLQIGSPSNAPFDR